MKNFCAILVLLTPLVLIVSSLECPWNENKLNRKIKQYNKLQRVLKKCGHTTPTDGNWSDFGDWSQCPADCGGGSQKKTRSCTNPVPAYGGSNCVGDAEETKECKDQPCELYMLKVFCDDDTTVYIDGVQKYTDRNWQGLASLSVPLSSRVIAIKCYNRIDRYGIVAAMKDAEGNDVMVSNSSWKCAGVAESGWEKPDFLEGDNWKQARDLCDCHFMRSGGYPWNKIISPGRRSIWSSGGRNDRTAYCRKVLN